MWKYEQTRPSLSEFYICISNNQHILERGGGMARQLSQVTMAGYVNRTEARVEACVNRFLWVAIRGFANNSLPEFFSFSHLPVSRNRFLDIQYLEQTTRLLFVVDRTYKFDSHGRQDWSLSDDDFHFQHQAITPIDTWAQIRPHSISSHLSPPLWIFLATLQSWERWAGDDLRGSRVNDSQFPALIAVIFFLQTPDTEI